MTDGQKEGVFCMFLSTVLATAMITTWLAGNFAQRNARAEAIEHGVGEYYIDDNYNKEFRWITEER